MLLTIVAEDLLTWHFCLEHKAAADSCREENKKIYYLCRDATVCHGCTHQMHIIWMSLFNVMYHWLWLAVTSHLMSFNQSAWIISEVRMATQIRNWFMRWFLHQSFAWFTNKKFIVLDSDWQTAEHEILTKEKRSFKDHVWVDCE